MEDLKQGRVRPISWWWAALASLLVAASVAVTVWVMLKQTQPLTGAERASARIEAIKTSLTVGAGTGGAAALLLALRRQWLNEHTHIRQEAADAVSEFDATERRITELYTAASGQLGSENASVRLAGLYALERLAHDHPTHRQTIVDVFCAYLRMPLAPQAPPPVSEADLAAMGASQKSAYLASQQNAHLLRDQERVVRETVNTILSRHLSAPVQDGERAWPPRDLHWADIDIDLRGAELEQLDLSACRMRIGNFTDVTFRGRANFTIAEFTDHVYFHNARFDGDAWFRGAWFGLRSVFVGATFHEQPNFENATFQGMIMYYDVTAPKGFNFKNARAGSEFNTNWGDSRTWPDGWTERVAGAGDDSHLQVARRTLAYRPVPLDLQWLQVVSEES